MTFCILKFLTNVKHKILWLTKQIHHNISIIEIYNVSAVELLIANDKIKLIELNKKLDREIISFGYLKQSIEIIAYQKILKANNKEIEDDIYETCYVFYKYEEEDEVDELTCKPHIDADEHAKITEPCANLTMDVQTNYYMLMLERNLMQFELKLEFN
ncbi:unnamed protein product [Rotaria sordida]|uniref:Uncharacterized protein n=1 Tax=Rotaria sordida TaxID=392033 RepID=A0A815CWR4_9BILA|nr:unnamed protein product [Rotaria sordida]